MNEELDYICIEILKKDKINQYLIVDDEILEKNYNEFKNEEIILFAYNKDKNDKEPKRGCEFGIILGYNQHTKKFISNYNSSPGASGGAILLKKNYKIIGIHTGGLEKYKKIGDINKEIKTNLFKSLSLTLNDMKSNKKSFFLLKIKL